jgi:hypothetical protein
MRKTIGQGLVKVLQGITDPATNLPVYGYVKHGAIFDPSGYASWAEVTFYQGRSTPYGNGGTQVGWRINDTITFEVTSGWQYDTDSTAATENMLNAMDIVLPIMHSHVVIPSVANPSLPIASVWMVTEDDHPEHAMPVRFPDGKVWLLWRFKVNVRQQYNVILQSV